MTKPQRFALSVLSISILLMTQAHALQVLSDQALREVEGQDGFNADINFTEAKIDKVEWIDQTGRTGVNDTGEMEVATTFSGINISRGNLAADQKLGAKVSLDVYGSEQGSGAAGIHFNMQNTLGKVTVDKLQVCVVHSGCSPNAHSMGGLEIESYQPIVFNLLTTNGLFNKNSKTFLDLSLKDARVAIKQKDGQGQQNMLSMEHLNINISTLSYLSIDPKNGITLTSGKDGFADFIRDEITGRPGINLEFALNNRSLIRAGANGRMVNGVVELGSSAAHSGILGKVSTRSGDSVLYSKNDVAGSSGIRIKVAGEFTNDLDKLGDKATTLELGGAGAFAYGLRFENITALRTRSNIQGNEQGDRPLTSERAGLDMGGMYINLAYSHSLDIPINPNLTNLFMGTTQGNNAVRVASNADYTHNVINQNTNYASAVLSVRNLDFMALSRRGRFIVTPDVTDATKLPSTEPAKWGLGLPIHDLNANFAFFSLNSAAGYDYIATRDANGVPILENSNNAQRIGFSAAMSTKGVNDNGSKSTSILLIDGADNTNYANGMVTPTDYYLGLRNIDMMINAFGKIGFEAGHLNVSLPNFKFAMAAQLAAGYLPGAKYRSCPSSGGCYAPSNSFTTNNDVLLGLKVRTSGKMFLSLVPRQTITSQNGLVEGVNALNILGIYQLSNQGNLTNSIQIVDADGSTIGFDNLRGVIGFDNNIIVVRHEVA